MLLLNVSDIHFKYPRCSTSSDADKAFRTMVLKDARDMRRKLGDVGAILVTGDIAATGIKEEYEYALEWLYKLADLCGCSRTRIYVVPGNHDVNRSISLSDVSVGDVQKAILKEEYGNREKTLEARLNNEVTASALFSPTAAYNDFAANFSCQNYPSQPFWIQDIQLDSNTTLRLHGLNSTLFSGIDGKNDSKNSLYISPLQTVLDPEDDVLNVVLCHHPPDWCCDNDEIEDCVRERAVLHFFGHKHRQRFDLGVGYVRLSAGAINPDRNEPGWVPGYNLVRLAISSDTAEGRTLSVETHLRDFQQRPARFVPRLTACKIRTKVAPHSE